MNNGSAILRFPNLSIIDSTYLKLSGGTLTGVLNGTSIVCTGNITAPNFIGIASSAKAINANSNVCDIAKGYNYDSGELNINYECATTGKPILKHIFRDGNKGYSSIYCKNLETSGTITSTGSITATSITSTGSITATSITSTGRITGGENIIATANIGTTNGLLTSTKNDNTVTIGSQSRTACHIKNSADIPFYFNRGMIIDGNIYPYSTTPGSCGTSASPWNNTYTNVLTLNGSAVADHIIDKGTSGIWTYRKWASGAFECWGTWAGSLTAYYTSTQYGQGYYKSIDLPFTLASAPMFTFVAQIGDLFSIPSNFRSTASSITCYACSDDATTGAKSCKFNIDVKGRWKL